MFDSVGLSYIGDVQECEKHLSNLDEKTNRESGEIVTYGLLGNMRVKIRGDFLSVYGSIPRYLLGSNLTSLSRKATQECMNKLSDEIHLDMKEAQVFRLDIANNLILENEISSYLSCFGNSRHYKKDTYDQSSVIYRNSKRTAEFYNKARETRAKKKEIPEFLADQHILRYELQLKKRVKTQLKRNEVKGSMLYDRDFFHQIVNLWQNEYYAIEKLNNVKLIPEVRDMLTKQKLINYLALRGLKNELGEKAFLDMLEQEKGNFKSERQFYRLKNAVKELSKVPELIEPSEAIRELDKKIKQVADIHL